LTLLFLGALSRFVITHWRESMHKDHIAASRIVTDAARFARIRTHTIRGNMADEDLKAELERLRRENEALKQGAKRGVSLKVSEKGGVSVYGLGRFPITLYQEQWTKLLDMADQIRAFIAEHQGELKKKE
jgi:hypothetical protein